MEITLMFKFVLDNSMFLFVNNNKVSVDHHHLSQTESLLQTKIKAERLLKLMKTYIITKSKGGSTHKEMLTTPNFRVSSQN